MAERLVPQRFLHVDKDKDERLTPIKGNEQYPLKIRAVILFYKVTHSGIARIIELDHQIHIRNSVLK